jgi:outer membrane protein assembly factor BamB
LFAIQPGGSGELSPEKKNAQFTTCQWLQERQGPGMASSVSSGKFVYTLESNILKCFNAETGERLYQQRLPGLDLVAASPLLIGNKLLVLDEEGGACLIADGPTFEVIGSGQLPDTFWATPAVADGAIYFRGLESIYCIRSKE